MPASEDTQYKLDIILSIFLGILTILIIWNFVKEPSINIIEENSLITPLKE